MRPTLVLPVLALFLRSLRPNLRTARSCPSRMEGRLDHPSDRPASRANGPAFPPHVRPGFRPRPATPSASAPTTASSCTSTANGSATGRPAATWPTGATSASTWRRSSTAGQNLITATVWNFGVFAPVAQMSDRTAFLLESEATGRQSHQHSRWLAGRRGTRPARLSTALRHSARPISPPGPAKRSTPPATTGSGIPSAAGPAWVPAASPMRDSIFPGVNQAHSADTTGDNSWGLIPDALPHMEYEPTSAGRNRPCRLRWPPSTFPNQQ